MFLTPFALDRVSPLVKANLGCISLQMLMLTLENPCVIFWGFIQLQTLESILVSPSNTVEPATRTSISSWIGSSKNWWGGKPISYLWQEEQFSSKHPYPLFLFILCSARPYQINCLTTLTEFVRDIVLCNWHILWQNALYLYLGKSK